MCNARAFLLAACLVPALARAETKAGAQPVLVPPELVHKVDAIYPAAQLAARKAAQVIVAFTVDDAGQVRDLEVVRSGGSDFDAAALEAARALGFRPGTADGRPVAVRVSWTFDFTPPHEAAPEPARLDGVVTDRESGRPLAGIELTVEGAAGPAGARAVTDEDGRFTLAPLAPGTRVLTLRGDGLAPITVEETLAPGEERAVAYAVARPRRARFESTVRARVAREVTETVVHTDEARRVAGTQGDALKVVEDLPGVARAAFGAGQLVVWGSQPADTRVYVDGVEVPALYHLGGLRATVNDALVRDLAFSPGGFSAEHGRGLGGLVLVETRPIDSGVHGYVGADVLDASALIAASIGTRVRIEAAGRYSLVDRILGGLITPQIAEAFTLPRWADWQLKATLALRPREELSLLVLGADDHQTRSIDSSDPSSVRKESTDLDWVRVALRWARSDAGRTVEVTPFVGHDARAQSSRFGATPASLSTDAWVYGLRARARRELYARRLFRLALQVGLDLEGTRTDVARTGSLTVPPREGDRYVFGQPPGTDVASDRFSAHLLDAGPFAGAELVIGPLTLAPSLRVDAWLIEGSALTPPVAGVPPVGSSRFQLSVDPRLAVTLQAHARVLLRAAVGLYHQAPAPEELSPVFGNPTLGLARALHATLGVTLRATSTLSAELTVFYKQLDFLVARSPLAQPELARALLDDGSGRSWGGQLLVRQEAWHGLSGWVSYTLSRAERRDTPNGNTRLFDFDQTHVLTIVAGYGFRGWSFGARFRYASGFPRTPVEGAFFDARADRYEPLFGAQNAIRLPDFVQLDVRVEKAFRFRRAGLDLYLDVQNVTYQKNAEEIVYSADFSKRGYLTGLPTLAVAGARVLW